MKSIRGAANASQATGRASPVKSSGFGFSSDDRGLTFYGSAPDCELSAREFEEHTCQRLKVLHSFDRLCGYDTPLGRVHELSRDKIHSELQQNGLLLDAPFGSAAETYPDRKADFCRRDAISHFALRLAFCKTKDSRDWLLKQEQRLFVYRFEELTAEAQADFFEASKVVRCRKFNDKAPNLPEKLALGNLQNSTYGAKIWNENDSKPAFDTNFYEMPFGEVPPSLLAHRKVVLHEGKAYVPSSALKLILASRFKERLAAGLEVAFSGLPSALRNPTVGPFLQVLQDHGLQLLIAPKGNTSTEGLGECLTLQNFEELLVRSFPPCMRRVVERQRENRKHLKHAGRLQLRPFLKDCGFTFEDSMNWWRQELTLDASIDGTTFDKNYTYDVDHAYGRKGHLQGQHCFGCPKIIDFPYEASGQVHGCVFKHLEMPALKQQLHKWRIPESSAAEIEKLVSNGKHYQLGCIEYFKAMHVGHEGDGVGNAPMDFFRESCRFHDKKKEDQQASSQKP